MQRRYTGRGHGAAKEATIASRQKQIGQDLTDPLIRALDAPLTRRDLGRLVAGAAGAAGSPVGAPAATSMLQEVPRGGSLSMAIGSDIVTLETPFAFLGTALDLLGGIYDSMTAVNPTTNETEGVLATRAPLQSAVRARAGADGVATMGSPVCELFAGNGFVAGTVSAITGAAP
jgi:hypothetical protein